MVSELRRENKGGTQQTYISRSIVHGPFISPSDFTLAMLPHKHIHHGVYPESFRIIYVSDITVCLCGINKNDTTVHPQFQRRTFRTDNISESDDIF